MADGALNLSPLVQALLATLFTWGFTALGAATVFLTRRVNPRLMDWLLGFAGGVMIAACFWSLLSPAIELAEQQGVPGWIPVAVGFLLGGAFLKLLDWFLPHFPIGILPESGAVNQVTLRRSVLFVTAIILHNIPEGLAIGVAFGAADIGGSSATLGAAMALALGMGLHSFPEGIAVAMPLRHEGLSPARSFWYGQLSGMVEPLAGVIGAAAVLAVRPILPYAFGFAAGAMVSVVVREVIPRSQRGGHPDLATLGAMLGFVLMTVMDVALG
jgi:ZIP family zinc transporter